MKVALCISGQMRSYRECYPLLKKYLLDPLEPDVFIHTWSNSGVSRNIHRSFQIKDGQSFRYKHQEHAINRDELLDFYSASEVVVEDAPDNCTNSLNGVTVPDILKEAEPQNYKGAIPMFYKIWKCNELKCDAEAKGGFTYDLVIKIRPDIEVKGYLPVSLFSKYPNAFFRPTAMHGKLPGCFVTDQFGLGSSEIMNYYCSLFNHLSEYWNRPLGDRESLFELGFTEQELDDYPFNLCHRVGERLMTYHMLRSGFRMQDVDTPFNIRRVKVNGFQVIYRRVLRKMQYIFSKSL